MEAALAIPYRTLTFILIVLTLAACGGTARPEAPAARPPDCTIAGGSAAPVPREVADAPIVVAIEDVVDRAHAPQPVNAAERLVFGQVYEPLVRIDCTGVVRAALASSWSRSPEGRAWLFTLRDGARFHDGTPVTPRDVMEGWAAPGRGTSGTSAPIASIAVLDDRTLRVEMVAPAEAEPLLFSTPAFAVHRAAPSGWALGTGAYEVDIDSSVNGTIRLRPARFRGGDVAGGGAPGMGAASMPLEFRVVRGDARNALDAGGDVLVTRDAAVIDYAAQHPSFTATPLPWDVAYVLFTMASAPAGDPLASGPLPAPVLEGLARDAVPGDARVSAAEGWMCPGPARAPERASRSGARIAFPRADRAAAALAERLAALSRPTDGRAPAWLADVFASPGALAAAALTPAELTAALRTGAAAAFVLPVDLRATGWCPDVAGRTALRALPLVDVRSTAIVRRSVEGVLVDGAATLRFDGVRRTG